MGEALYKLHAWLSPGYPVGAYTYSGGLETAVVSGRALDAASTCDWVGDVLGAQGRNDAILLTAAYRAEQAGDVARLDETAELAKALAPSVERLLETEAQGAAFADVTGAAWGGSEPAPYPVAVGRSAAAHEIPLEETLVIFLQAMAANLVSAAVRLVPLGQTDGQRVLADLMPEILALAREAAQSTLEEIGGCAIGADIASMRHETLDVRLFRS